MLLNNLLQNPLDNWLSIVSLHIATRSLWIRVGQSIRHLIPVQYIAIAIKLHTNTEMRSDDIASYIAI